LAGAFPSLKTTLLHGDFSGAVDASAATFTPSISPDFIYLNTYDNLTSLTPNDLNNETYLTVEIRVYP
jgi:hypothetical protein